ncbi:ABC transporter permease [Dyadobacter sp. SG02]|uniref:ABC transporter permease n=1 Tax=Dyadobacter sp. SG02 TaxID=1855291 RepID=UPI0038D39025
MPGLFGLTTFSAEQRRKKIGIRKVLGATAINIVTMLSKYFLELVVISVLLASACLSGNQKLAGRFRLPYSDQLLGICAGGSGWIVRCNCSDQFSGFQGGGSKSC